MLREGMYARVHCVIDGLDVYQEGMNEFITKIAEIFSLETRAKNSVLKLLCTTRSERSILESLRTSKHRILNCNQHDLDTFINSQVNILGERFTNNMRQTITDKLRENSNCSFLWLEVVIRRIHSIDVSRLRKIEDIIKESSKILDNLYFVLVQSIVQRDRDNARLLACVVYARHPLDLRALQDAMAMDSERTYTNYEQCEQNKPSLTLDGLYNAFGTLLNVAEDKVYCLHQSIRDYFHRCNPLKDFVKSDPQILLADISMAYLSLEDFGRPWQDRETLYEKFSLFEYAAVYWYSHIRTRKDFSHHPRFQHFLKQIVPPHKNNAKVWMNEHYNTRYGQYPSRISEVAISYDIGWLAELLLNRESCGISDDFARDCLLRAASQKGIVLEILLKHEKSTELTITDAIVRIIAGQHRCTTIALLLDQRGADVQITEEVVRAAAGNHESGEEIMSLLLERRGADVQITEKAIELIVEKFGRKVVALLGRRSVDVLGSNKHGQRSA